jgi:hypothetical protein
MKKGQPEYLVDLIIRKYYIICSLKRTKFLLFSERSDKEFSGSDAHCRIAKHQEDRQYPG